MYGDFSVERIRWATYNFVYKSGTTDSRNKFQGHHIFI